jgi:acetoin utilization deacetylase AcuC-like enzyme
VAFVYSGQYRLDLPGVPYDPHRGEHILTFLIHEGLIARDDLHWPQAASLHALARVHSDDYLEEVLRPGGTQRIVGLQVPAQAEDRFLSMQRFMTGGTLLATRLARASGRPAVNLGGGLHHAHSDHGQGFCAFNDIAVAIAEARHGGFRGRILVVDLDLHDGDGTRQIFADDPTVHTYSIHNQDWGDAAALGATTLALGEDVEDAAYLAALERTLPPVVAEVRPQLVYYLAGCDPAATDRLGNWKITAQGLLRRDRFVMETLAPALDGGAHLVVTLAGGYGTNAWRYSARWFSWWLSGGDRRGDLQPGDYPEPPSTDEITLLRYRHRAALVEPDELTGDGTAAERSGGKPKGDWSTNWNLSAAEILPELSGHPPPVRLLGYYSTHGVELALERYGLLSRLREMGFTTPTIEFDFDNPTGHTLRIFADRAKTELVVEARVRRDQRTLPGFEVLFVEWLMLQNPHAHFPPHRPRLPGQQHPGLGMLRDAVAMFLLICERLELDGLAFVPAHYHLAAQSRRFLRFVDIADEARFRALQRDLRDLPLAAASRAIDAGRVVDAATGEPLTWRPGPMVIPVSEALRQRVEDGDYERRAEELAARLDFRLAPPRDTPATGPGRSNDGS